MSTLAVLRDKVREDLRDDPAPQQFSDSELERWVLRAVDEVSAARPREQEDTMHTGDGTRDIDVSGLSGLLRLVAAEYPTAQWPPVWVRFSHWGDVMSLHTEGVLAAAEDVRVLWESSHTLDAVGSTLSPTLENIVVLGGGAYALDAYAGGGANQLLTAGSAGQRALRREADGRLAEYGAKLRLLRSRLRRRAMYTPAEPGPSQSTDFGPP